jgi:hypothetical protein
MADPDSVRPASEGDREWSPADYRNQWNLFEVHCRDFYVAGRHSARQNWWLHCWKHVPADHDDPRVVVIGTAQPPFVEVPENERTRGHRSKS